jgi:hypothetical protein
MQHVLDVTKNEEDQQIMMQFLLSSQYMLRPVTDEKYKDGMDMLMYTPPPLSLL